MDPPQIPDRPALERALGAPLFLLFKHSRACPVSAFAFKEYSAFHAAHPEVPTGWIDVRAQRDGALLVEARTGVRHESPQALLIRDGAVAWHESHEGIKEEDLAAAVSGP